MAAQKTDAATDEAHDPKTQPGSNAQKDPETWVTGDEPMTGAQASYLKTLCEETGEAFDETLTKAEASQMIDRLKAESPRLKDDP